MTSLLVKRDKKEKRRIPMEIKQELMDQTSNVVKTEVFSDEEEAKPVPQEMIMDDPIFHDSNNNSIIPWNVSYGESNLRETPRDLPKVATREIHVKREKEETEEEEEESKHGTIGLFSREITQMMFGAGDEVPFVESIKFLNDLAIDYMTDITCQAMTIGKPGQIEVQDLLYLTRKNSAKNARIKSLLEMNEELKSTRRAFDVNTIVENNTSKSNHEFDCKIKKRKNGQK